MISAHITRAAAALPLAALMVASPSASPHAARPATAAAEHAYCQAANRYGDWTTLARFTAADAAGHAASLPARYRSGWARWGQDIVGYPPATPARLRTDAAAVQRMCRRVNGY